MHTNLLFIGAGGPKPHDIGLHFFFVSLFWPLFGGQKRMRCPYVMLLCLVVGSCAHMGYQLLGANPQTPTGSVLVCPGGYLVSGAGGPQTPIVSP